MMFRVILAVVLLTPTSPAAAQITSATLSGTVKDQPGGVLPGVDVVIKNLDTGLSRSVVTDANGDFTVRGRAAGRYERRARLQGFTTAVRTGIALADLYGDGRLGRVQPWRLYVPGVPRGPQRISGRLRARDGGPP